MTLSEFITKWNGKYADFDGAYGAQCVDIVQFYNRDVIGGPSLVGNAINIWTTFDNRSYTRVTNAPANYPQPGDVVIWGGPNAAVGTTQYGHIAVCSRPADAASFVAFSQNWPEGSPCHEVTFTYTAVLGWLRPLAPTPPPAPLPPDHHVPVDAADAADTLRRHSAALGLHPAPGAVNALLAAVKRWPPFSK